MASHYKVLVLQKVYDSSPGGSVVRPGRLDRVVGVERSSLERQLRLELGREREQRVVLQRGEPVLGQARKFGLHY